ERGGAEARKADAELVRHHQPGEAAHEEEQSEGAVALKVDLLEQRPGLERPLGDREEGARPEDDRLAESGDGVRSRTPHCDSPLARPPCVLKPLSNLSTL